MKALSALLSLSALTASSATVDDLWITEVSPATGAVEVTNVGIGSYTTSSNLRFCHRFNYSSAIPAGTTFTEGESKVFTLPSLHATDSDLWLYRATPFGDASNIITGLKWGPQDNVGRTSIANTARKWDDSKLTLPKTGESLQLVVRNAEQGANWQIQASNLGSHSFPITNFTIRHSESAIELNWEEGQPPFKIEKSNDLSTYTTLQGIITGRSLSLDRSTLESRQFFKVEPISTATEARYRLTFTSVWNDESFSTVPSSDHFSGLIGGLHNHSVTFWSPAATASPGIKAMAETGSKFTLRTEVENAISSGFADQVLSGNGLGSGNANLPSRQTSIEFSANQAHPLITVTSMIAPSPDWFVGLSGVSLTDINNAWENKLSFDLLAYDAGTDSGATFRSANLSTSPPEPIFRISSLDPNFAPPAGVEITNQPIPIATIVIERID